MNSRVTFFANYFWRIQTANDLASLADLLFGATGQLYFRYVWLGAHVDPNTSPPGSVLLHNYSSEWVKAYSALGGVRADPVLRFAEHVIDGFAWDAPEFLSSLSDRQYAFLREAKRFELGHGYTLPLPSVAGISASCSLVPMSGELDMDAVTLVVPIVWQIYSRAMHLAGRQVVACVEALSNRERDCLHMKAEGATNVEIAGRLGICSSTVKRHLDQAQIRLSAKSRTHAVALALRFGQI